jgi:hypothetical protein
VRSVVLNGVRFLGRLFDLKNNNQTIKQSNNSTEDIDTPCR